MCGAFKLVTSYITWSTKIMCMSSNSIQAYLLVACRTSFHHRLIFFYVKCIQITTCKMFDNVVSHRIRGPHITRKLFSISHSVIDNDFLNLTNGDHGFYVKQHYQTSSSFFFFWLKKTWSNIKIRRNNWNSNSIFHQKCFFFFLKCENQKYII